ncbi:hypothetical protein KUCAC02_029522, partial [Chaenocephalus aceratus]
NPLDVASSWARRTWDAAYRMKTLVQTAALLTSEIVDRTVATPAQPEQSTPAPPTSPTVTLSTACHCDGPGVDCPPLVEVETEYLTPPARVLTSPAPKSQRRDSFL